VDWLSYYELWQYFAVAGVLLLASTIQATVGFAAGLFGIPLLLLAGFELHEAVVITMVTSSIQSVCGYVRLRRDIDPRVTIGPILIRTLTLPVGAYLLQLSGKMAQQQVQQLVGALIVVVLAVFTRWHVQPRPRLHPLWKWLAFSSSGLMAGFCGMGGPPMVLWVMAHDWTAEKSRAFLFVIFVTTILPQGTLYWILFGQQMVPPMLLGLGGVAATYAGSTIGLSLGARLPKPALKRVSHALLLLIAVTALLSPLLPWNRPAAASQGVSVDQK